MSDQYGVIYLLKNHANNKRYVGQTVRSLAVRILRHSIDNIGIIGKALNNSMQDQ